MAQSLQLPLVTVVVMILHGNWGMGNSDDKETSADTCHAKKIK